MNFFDLPEPDIGSPFTDDHLQLFGQALELAWQQLEFGPYYKHLPFEAWMWADEDEITSRLVELVNRLRDNPACPWYHPGLFQSISRDAKQATKTYGTEKMPDMTLSVQDAGRYSADCHALFVECKVITGRSSKTVRNYVREGIARFVSKTYAPFSSKSMMVAYVLPGMVARTTLDTYFKSSKVKPHPDQAYDSCAGWADYPLDFPSVKLTACRSEHDRGDAAKFQLTHMWLSV